MLAVGMMDHHHEHEGVIVTEHSIITAHDTIPRFAADPDVIAIQNGRWSDASIWSTGQVPGSDSTIQIPDGTIVQYDVASDVELDAIEVFGELRFVTDTDTSLWLNELVVMPGGALIVGTQDSPIQSQFTAEIVFTDTPDEFGRHYKTGTVQNPGIDPSQYGNGLIVFGTAIMHGTSLDETFARLSGDIFAGDQEIQLQVEVNGWQIGDELVLPDTRHVSPVDYGNQYSYRPEWETRFITAIDGNRISLNEPLEFDHLAPRDADGSLTERFDGETLAAHAGNLTRNVVLRSENPAGVRGHAMFLAAAHKDIRYTAFESLGRTKAASIDSTTFDSSGTVTHIGTNQVGRYSDHNHHTFGPAGGIEVGEDLYQVVTLGNAYTDSLKWAVTIHDSHYGLYSENVIYDTDGAALATESGGETGNLISDNFVIHVRNPTPHLPITGLGVAVENDGGLGDGFWFAGPFNDVHGNVAANIAKTAFMYWPKEIVSSNDRFKFVRVPLHPGDNTHIDGEYKVVNALETPVTSFANNEIYGATTAGVSVWQIGDQHWFPHITTPTTLVDTTVWHVTGSGLWFYYASDYLIDGWIQRGDPSSINLHVRDGGPQNPSTGTAIVHGGASAKTSTIRRADVQNMTRGYLNRGSGSSDELQVIDSFFDNFENIVVRPYQDKPTDGSRDFVIDNVVFGNSFSPGAINTVDMSWQPATIERARTPETTRVLNFDGTPGLNLELFYAQQAFDAVVPAKGGETLFPGGLIDNATGYENFGISPVGRIAPISDVEQANVLAKSLGISGLVIDQTQSMTFLRTNVVNEPAGPTLYFGVFGELPGDGRVEIRVGDRLFHGSGRSGNFLLNDLLAGNYQIHSQLLDSAGVQLASYDTSLRLPLTTPASRNSNQSPKISSVTDSTHLALEPLTIQINASDRDGAISKIELRNPPLGANIDSAGLFSWTPTNEQIGRRLIEIVATDNRGATAIEQFLVDVNFNTQGETVIGSWSASEYSAGQTASLLPDSSTYSHPAVLNNITFTEGAMKYSGGNAIAKVEPAEVHKPTRELTIEAVVSPKQNANYIAPIVKFESGSWPAYELSVTNSGTSKNGSEIRYGYFASVRTESGKHTLAFRTLDWNEQYDTIKVVFNGAENGGTLSLFVNGLLADSKSGIGSSLIYAPYDSQQVAIGGSDDSRRYFTGNIRSVKLTAEAEPSSVALNAALSIADDLPDPMLSNQICEAIAPQTAKIANFSEPISASTLSAQSVFLDKPDDVDAEADTRAEVLNSVIFDTLGKQL